MLNIIMYYNLQFVLPISNQLVYQDHLDIMCNSHWHLQQIGS